MQHLDLTQPSPAENLALDEALLECAENLGGGETLRFWESPVEFVVLGYANQAAIEVNVEVCAGAGVPVLRRCSGGGTVLQGPGCLNYNLVLRIDETGPTRSIHTTNGFIMERHRAVIEKLLGQPVAVQGHTDLTVGGLKFSGNAQRRRRNFLVFHGTFLLHFDLGRISQLLRMPSKPPDYRADRGHERFLTNLNVSADRVKSALRQVWKAETPIEQVPDISALMSEKYSREDWNRKF